MNKSVDELAVELTIALLKHNSSITNLQGASVTKLLNATETAKYLVVFKEVLEGNRNPFETKK